MSEDNVVKITAIAAFIISIIALILVIQTSMVISEMRDDMSLEIDVNQGINDDYHQRNLERIGALENKVFDEEMSFNYETGEYYVINESNTVGKIVGHENDSGWSAVRPECWNGVTYNGY